MSSKKLFSNKSVDVKLVKPTDTVNNAGGQAYSLDDKAALAQLAMTGCFNGTYYVSDEDQLKKVLDLANKLPAKYVAQLAVYSRQYGLMKDMPAVLAAVVAGKDSDLLSKIFDKVVDSPKMLRNFVQILRSGVVGRKSLGTRPKKLVQKYLESLTDEQLFMADVGNDPSLQDVIKLVHPKPTTKQRSAMFAYLLNKEYSQDDLSLLVRQFEDFKKDMSKDIPNVPFQKLTALPLTSDHWKKIASNATWNQIRQNLNTFARHNVLSDQALLNLICSRIEDKELVKRARVFPYQLFTTFQNLESSIPTKISVALQKAAEHALENIPEFKGKVYVMVDTSGSMSSPVTGKRGTATTKMSCIDVAALVAAAIMRKNSDVEVLPFDTKVHTHKLNPLDSIMTNAKILSAFGGGGTNCSLPLQELNRRKAMGDLVIYVSDNESWVDSSRGKGTATMNAWEVFKARNRNAKLVCIDLTPNTSTQVYSKKDVLNIGGFSDSVFEVINKFMEYGNDANLWIRTIEQIKL